ncbi:nucleolar transcription factor 1 isoform X3 [Pristis pectinata]|uniref:nucleolar transcription factor 1 isoform X3 n=1 Tax=Pristis pectinata TaxID=685728 RepID=UPI00223E1EB9|nr:nucleolar transcription factor 1 isoform X3 [Pristis pectinata]
MNGETAMAETAELSDAKEEWPKEDLLGLLDSMRSMVPSNDVMKFKTTESHMDWNKVTFAHYTAEMCKQKWTEISHEVRKFRTLSELILDVQENVKNPYKGKKLKNHPDFPKKPLTPYFRFFMEKRAKYAKLHPEMSNLDLTKILSKKYKELPEKKKMKYIQEFQKEKEDFEQSMARFREDHPELLESVKRTDAPEKPKTPQQLWYLHEKKAFMKMHPKATMKDVKEALGKQWSQLSDKKRLKWIGKSLEQRELYEEAMRDYVLRHPEQSISLDDLTKNTLTKAERQLKDKFDGRPTKPPPNGYSLYCAELMSNMKDIPSTERMVLCSKQWKMLSQKEKDAYQKRCEQKKKEYEINLHRFLLSLPEHEQQRVLSEEKMIGLNKKAASNLKQGGVKGVPSSPSDAAKEKYRRMEAAAKAESEQKRQGYGKDGKGSAIRGKLPEPPKTAEEIWQQNVIGDYLAKYRNDRTKAVKAMEATWSAMEKKEKLMWIKKAAEDQKRYEKELSEIRTPATNVNKKIKFEGEPKKPPMNGYQKFSQELLTGGELNHLNLKDRMVEIGKRWRKVSQAQKDRYKKMAEEQQCQYKINLEAWLKSISPQERAAYKEYTSNKRKGSAKVSSPNPKMKVSIPAQNASSQVKLRKTEGWLMLCHYLRRASETSQGAAGRKRRILMRRRMRMMTRMMTMMKKKRPTLQILMIPQVRTVMKRVKRKMMQMRMQMKMRMKRKMKTSPTAAAVLHLKSPPTRTPTEVFCFDLPGSTGNYQGPKDEPSCPLPALFERQVAEADILNLM